MGNSRDKKLYSKTKYTITGWFNVHYKRLQQRERAKGYRWKYVQKM